MYLWLCVPLFTLCAGESDWIANRAVTSVQFNMDMVRELRLDIVAEVTTAVPFRAGYAGFAADEDSYLVVSAPAGQLDYLKGGMLSHVGGFVFEGPGGTYSFIDFVLRAVPETTSFEMYDGQGNRLFTLDYAHGSFDPVDERFQVLNMDLMIAPEFAARLGDPSLVGTYLGTVDVTMDLQAPQGFELSSLIPCAPNYTGNTDVELTNLTSMSMAAREPGGRVAIAPSASLQNAGTADVRWFNSIAPSTSVGQHPYLVLALYRVANGQFDMLGQSDVKHAFFSVNSGCACDGAHILFVGCGDTYGAGTNLSRTYLAPRDEVESFTGTWSSFGSHFDIYPAFLPADDIRSHSGDPVHDSFEHRLVVQEPDLQTVGAKYYIEGWYVVQGDVDILNSMGYRQVTPMFTTVWTFTFDTPLAHGPTLDIWVDPNTPGPGNAHERLVTGEGELRVAARTNDLGGGMTHYEYVVLNLDFDRQIDAFTVPIPTDVNVTNLTFGDIDTNGANDWSGAVGVGEVTWTATAQNELDWGTSFRFGFDADAPPATGDTVLSVFAPGSPTTYTAASQVPDDICSPSDLMNQFPVWPNLTILDLMGLFCP